MNHQLYYWGLALLIRGFMNNSLDNQALHAQEMLRNSVLELFEFEKVIQLESREEGQIGSIEELIYLPQQNRIIVLAYDRAGEVLVFDGMGKYLFSLENRVEGQGKNRMAYEDSLLALYSFLSQKVQFYSIFDGSFKREYSLSILKKSLPSYPFILSNGEMYFYTDSAIDNSELNGGQYLVYKFKRMNFVNGYGKIEYNTNAGLGQMTIFRGNIIYSGALDGNLYRIEPRTDRETLFCSFPEVAQANQKTFPFDQYLLNHRHSWHRDVISFHYLWPVNGLLFVGKKKGDDLRFAMVDSNGKILKDHLLLYDSDIGAFSKDLIEKVYNPLKPPSQVIVRNINLFPYDDGLVQSSLFLVEENFTNFQIPNPKLVVFKFRPLFKTTPLK